MVLSTIGLLCAVVDAMGWGIEVVAEGEVNWAGVRWLEGDAGKEDTVYINGAAKLRVEEGERAWVYGVRIGDGLAGIASLQIAGGALRTGYIVVGDAMDSNASFVYAGGKMLVEGTPQLGFEMGNPANAPKAAANVLATFAAGRAELGPVRVNLRQHRKARIVVYGTLPQVTAKSLKFEVMGAAHWDKAELQFVLDENGIAPLKIREKVQFGDGDRVVLSVDGTRYTGGAARYILIDADELEGRPAALRIEGFKAKAHIRQEGGQWLLVIGE